jgi:hypothetical protein
MEFLSLARHPVAANEHDGDVGISVRQEWRNVHGPIQAW